MLTNDSSIRRHPELFRIRQEILGDRAALRNPYGAGEQLEIGGVIGSAGR